jgi:SAM-dependent methyltransferase
MLDSPHFHAELTEDWNELARLVGERFQNLPRPHILNVVGGSGDTTTAVITSGVPWAHARLPDVLRSGSDCLQNGLKPPLSAIGSTHLPYYDQSFDIVVCIFGATFLARPDALLSEMLRVCRIGGLVWMSNWTPDSIFGHVARLMTKIDPNGAQRYSGAGALWGDASGLEAKLSNRLTDLQFRRRKLCLTFASPPADVAAHFNAGFGPCLAMTHSHPEDQVHCFKTGLTELWARRNLAGDRSTAVAADYLTVAGVRAR